MIVKKITPRSKVSEIDSTIFTIIAAYENSNCNDDIYLTPLFTDLKVTSKTLSIAIKQLKVKSKLDGLDDIRDSDFRSLYYLVFGNIYSPQAEIREAAKMVFDIIGSGDLAVTEKSYTIESSLIGSMLKQLDSPSVKNAITALPDIKVLIDTLRVSQREFMEEELAFDAAKAEYTHTLHASDIKKDILEQFNGKILLYINGMAAVNELQYGAFARVTAQIIDDNNSAVKRRLGK